MSNTPSKGTASKGVYDPQLVEKKWQKIWDTAKTWSTKPDPNRQKYYVLDMFPYPSGRLHMGHVRNYTLGDVIARFKRSQGYLVLHPMGWDAFGLPAENAAIKHKRHPEEWTLENIDSMRKQLKRLGLGYDWDRELATCLPEYYKWEQLFFIEMFEKGLAYKKKSNVNWCPSCQTVLANEQVEDGKCWRCENETTTKELNQWFLKITEYAEELLSGIDQLTGWPERVRSMQKHWIGKSTGAEIDFKLEKGNSLRVFTTRPDTLFGVTFMAIAPEHPLLETLVTPKQKNEVENFTEKLKKQDSRERTSENSPKEGIFTGSYAIHPFTGDKIPIYTANFVLMEYGTGALMAVPAHDSRDHMFAKKYGIPIQQVIEPTAPNKVEATIEDAPFLDSGQLVNSDQFTGIPSEEAKSKITSELEKIKMGKKAVTYRMRDWGLSRQRYWGAPIPMIYCPSCGTIPVKKEDLPVVLPKDVEFTDEGGSPLAHHPNFLNVKCPKCNQNAKRETDTMDTFMESSWYYLRYLSPKEDQRPFDPKELEYWLGVDQYIGGIEHATMHLLYFRFFHKVLRDFGYLPQGIDPQDLNEPVRNLFNQGIVYKDGAKMSKSKGNVVEPDSIINKYGADTARLFSMFAAPPEKVLEWSDQGVEGAFRFLNRVWRMVEQHHSIIHSVEWYRGKHQDLPSGPIRNLRAKVHATISKVKYDNENGYHFNTSIAAIMELVNEIYGYKVELGRTESREVLREAIEISIQLLHPFTPHVTEELWRNLGHTTSLVGLPFPSIDSGALVKDSLTIVVQVNGKLRGNIEIAPHLEKDKVLSLAQENEKVASYLKDKNIVKTIYVPKKLINFVVK